MPLYDYICPKCKVIKEINKRITDNTIPRCQSASCDLVFMEQQITTTPLIQWNDGQYRGNMDKLIRKNPKEARKRIEGGR